MKSKPWLPYVAPFGVYMAFLLVQSRVELNLLWAYPLRVLCVGAALVYFWRHYAELRGPASGRVAFNVTLAIVVGLVAIVVWIALDPFYPGLTKLMTGKPPVPFDPFSIENESARWSFIALRAFGAVVVVPVMEEIFWRAFLIRWIEDEDFQRVPVGTFGWRSFGFTVLLFGAEHDQWIAGLICGALYNWLFYRTRSVWACIIAHAVSNAALAGWVLARGDWKFW
jgi:hypothetical protein